MLLRLAFRNIFRHFTRTFLTFLAIALGLATLIWIDSLLTGIDQDSFEKIINYETGHIKILDRTYRADEENLPLDKSIEDPAELVKKFGLDPEVAGVTSRINFRIMLSDGIDQYPAVGIAINPADDQSVFRLKQAVAKGEFLAGSEEAINGVGVTHRRFPSRPDAPLADPEIAERQVHFRERLRAATPPRHAVAQVAVWHGARRRRSPR